MEELRFWSLPGLILKMSWQKKPHGHHIVIHAMCTLLLTLRWIYIDPPRKYPEEQNPQARFNPVTYPPRYEMKMVVQEFCKLHEPKINKLKGRYSTTANLIFQSWLMDIKVHVEDHNLTEREAIQLVNDFTVERACNEVEFYMGMIVDDQQTFDGLVNHLKMHSSQGRLLVNWSVISTVDNQREMNWRMYLWITSRF